ncbi:MAG: hypothetical protein RL637_1508 [Pseudomonadota bacterium]|jgi:phosphoribosylamine--glycine ligase
MKILIVGNGGREHALAWKIQQSQPVSQIFVAPGNAGTAQEPKVQNVAIAVDDIEVLVHFAQQQAIDLTIIGPELPLTLGIVDRFQQVGLKCFGANSQAARLEASKRFSKDFMRKYHIPTAEYQAFTDVQAAIAYIQTKGAPIVVKADGLAAGKGVVVAQTVNEAIDAVEQMLSANRFGQAGHQVVIEEYLTGEEASFIVIADGIHALPMATSQDHKARDNGDLGPNTGGMGAYSPAPVVTTEIHQRVMDDVIYPTLRGMAAEGCPYSGFLYAGLMISPEGSVKVLEYNCRFGDPETQPIMMRLTSDLVELCLAALDQRLDQITIEWDTRVALAVVMAAGGYPDDYAKGAVISGLPTVKNSDCQVFHAGTQQQHSEIVTAGGRVLAVCALADSVKQAQQKAYQQVSQIQWTDVYYRTDIGYKALN